MTRDPGDERLRQAYLAPVGDAAPASGCPPDEQIWAASRGELSGERAEELLEHARGCAGCAESWKMARALGQEMAVGTATTGVVRRRRAAWIGLAAAAALVLGVVWLLPRFTGEAPVPVDEYREPSAGAIRSEIGASGRLPRDGFELRWSGAPAGTVYTLEIATERLDVIHRAVEIERSEYVVPPDALRDLDPGTVLLWRVDAVLPDASRVSSPVYRVTLE